MEEQLKKIYKMLDNIDIHLTRIEMMLNIDYNPEVFEDDDTKYKKLLEHLKGFDQISISFIQRKLAVGYVKASRLMDQLVKNKIVKPTKNPQLKEVIKK